MSDKYKQLAQDIIDGVGGETNIIDMRHCITRLRFHLKDEGLAKTDFLKKRDGIVTIIQSGGQYQIVIGNHVPDVYETILQVAKKEFGETQEDESAFKDANVINRFIDLMSGIFQPFLGPMAAAGMIKGLVAVLSALGVAESDGAYVILNAAGDGLFQFLPMLIAVTASKKFKMNVFTALAIGGAMLYPSLLDVTSGPVLYNLFEGTVIESPIYTQFLGLPLILGNGYYSTVIPMIFAIWFASKIEAFFKERLHDNVKSFMTPFMVILITVPVALLVLGPIATWGSNFVGASFTQLNNFSPILFGLVLGGLWQILVMFGLHWGLVPLAIIELTNTGESAIFAVISAVSFGQMGALLSMIQQAKDNKYRSLGVPAAISALFGVTEPSIYGFTLPAKLPFYLSCVAGALQGLYVGFFKLTTYQMAGLGIFSIPGYIDPSGKNLANLLHYLVAIILATGTGYLLTRLFYKHPQTQEDSEMRNEEIENRLSPETPQQKVVQEIIGSPLVGKAMPLNLIEDDAFASEALGKGIAIVPTENLVYAPTNGVVTSLFPTGHAIGITSDEGVEILIHIGMDTVQMEGEGFKSLVQQGDRVIAGQKLIEFDADLIKAAGYSVVTPVVITNTYAYADVLVTDQTDISNGDYLLTIVK